MFDPETGRSLGKALFGVTRTRTADRSCRLTLVGELDLATTPILDRALQVRDRVDAIVLDLGHLEFVDCAGLGTLLDWLARARREGWRLEVDRALSPQVAKLVALTGSASLLWPAQPPNPLHLEEPLP